MLMAPDAPLRRAPYWPTLPFIRSQIQFAAGGSYEVRVTKLTDAAPYNMGIGRLMWPAKLRFDGLVIASSDEIAVLAPPRPASRRIEYVGASDTSGYCLDGSTDDNNWRYAFVGWARQNCYKATPALLGRMLSADVQVACAATVVAVSYPPHPAHPTHPTLPTLPTHARWKLCRRPG